MLGLSPGSLSAGLRRVGRIRLCLQWKWNWKQSDSLQIIVQILLYSAASPLSTQCVWKVNKEPAIEKKPISGLQLNNLPLKKLRLRCGTEDLNKKGKWNFLYFPVIQRR